MSYQDVKDRLYRGHRKIANNTYLELRLLDIASVEEGWTKEEFIDMRLHGNLVARFYPDHLKLFSAGWYTTTTKARLNLALELANVNTNIHIDDREPDWIKKRLKWMKICQVGYQWYYGSYHKGDTKFTEGMCINYNGKVIGGK